MRHGLKTAILSLGIILLWGQSSAWAKGLVNVEQANGDTDSYTDVTIINARDTVYFQAPVSSSVLTIEKK